MPVPRPDLHHVCHTNGLSHRPSPTRSEFIPVYTVDDDELAGALERVNQEVNPGLIPLPILLEGHSPSMLGSSNRQNIAYAAIPQCQIDQPTEVVHIMHIPRDSPRHQTP